jgi:CheY-like chemotaxis protein
MKKILVVDDSWIARNMIAKPLTGTYELVFAGNGIEALETIDMEKPDLILLDLLMPEMDGFAVLEELKEREFAPPVIVLSADIQESTRKLALSLGAAAFMNKPPKGENLLHLLAEIVEGRNAR